MKLSSIISNLRRELVNEGKLTKEQQQKFIDIYDLAKKTERVTVTLHGDDLLHYIKTGHRPLGDPKTL